MREPERREDRRGIRRRDDGAEQERLQPAELLEERVRGDARQDGAHDDADGAEQRRRHGDLAQPSPRGLQAALVQDRDEADDADLAGELGVVELDVPPGPSEPSSMPSARKATSTGSPVRAAPSATTRLAARIAPTSRSMSPSSTALSCRGDRIRVAPVQRGLQHWGMAAGPKTRNIGRLSEIAQVAVRHGFGYFFERHRITDVLPWTARVEQTTELAGSERGRHLREMLDELGPTFVKFGQLLSTRPDVVPPDIVAELRGLQDDVRAFPFEDARLVVEAELGLTLEQAFIRFDEVPIAAASIGQVHRAALPNGAEVVVKVQRPNAPRQIESDLALLYQAAGIIKERVRSLDFIDAAALVDEFARSIRQELDYKAEGRNADQFRHNFAGSELVRVPKVYWTYSGSRILTLEFLEGASSPTSTSTRSRSRRAGSSPTG